LYRNIETQKSITPF